MKRTIIAPAVPGGAALGELKAWLAITTTREDAGLTALIAAALDTCEGFTRAMPLQAECEEMLPATPGWHSLATEPVRAITAIATVTPGGTRAAIDPGTHVFDVDAEGRGRVDLLRQYEAGRVAVRFTAGLAPDWDSLPDGLRHGVIRLAAHHYRERNDGGPANGPVAGPPAAVAALWQPWRRMRLA